MQFDLLLVTFNRLDYTRRTVGSLIASGALDECERLIVVDNHSLGEGFVSFLDELATYKKTFVLRRPKNDGWAAAVNDGLGMSRSPFVFLVNNDVEFEPYFYKDMLEVMQQTPAVLLGGWRHTAHSVSMPHPLYDEMTDVPAVCWLLRKTAMAEAGLLEERGACATKGGNGEDSNYVQRMARLGHVGAMKHDVCRHLDGY